MNLVGLVISLVAAVIAACAVTLTAFGLRRKTDEDYTAQQDRKLAGLEREIEGLKGAQIMTERELDDCRRGREDLQRQNYSLLAELHTLEMRDRRRDDG